MIFLDSGYFKGLLNEKDNHHEDALSIESYLKDLNAITVINTTVLVETLNRIAGSDLAVNNMYHKLHDENKVILLTGDDYFKSLEINLWYGNSINYSDCTIINTMMDRDIQTIVSFDSDFEKIGGFNVISSV